MCLRLTFDQQCSFLDGGTECASREGERGHVSGRAHESCMRVSIHDRGGIINTCGDPRRNKKSAGEPRDAGMLFSDAA